MNDNHGGSMETKQKKRKQAQPMSLLDGKPYVPAAATDIRETFRRFGWIGPEEQRKQKEAA